jgi:hypothetical protein
MTHSPSGKATAHSSSRNLIFRKVKTYRDDKHTRVYGTRYVFLWALHLSAYVVSLVPTVESPETRIKSEGIRGRASGRTFEPRLFE